MYEALRAIPIWDNSLVVTWDPHPGNSFVFQVNGAPPVPGVRFLPSLEASKYSQPEVIMPVFNPGDTVRIKSGPFASFISAVKKVDDTGGMLTVEVEVFGRRTPVEVAFSDVERVPPQPPYRPPLTSLN